MNPILFTRAHDRQHKDRHRHQGPDQSGLGKLIVAATGILLVSAIGILLTAPSQSEQGTEVQHHVPSQ
jgi:hypothetical protein